VIEHLWPILRVALIGATFVTGLEFVYYLGPNSRHSFFSTLPGAVLAIAIWLVGSAGLNYYLSHLSNYNATYGSMGALIGLMLWLYITALAILIGAELNAELTKLRAKHNSHRAVAETPLAEAPAERPIPAAQ